MEETRLKALDKIAERVKNAKCPAKKTEGNIVLEYLNLLVFQDLNEFTIVRPPDKKTGENRSKYVLSKYFD